MPISVRKPNKQKQRTSLQACYQIKSRIHGTSFLVFRNADAIPTYHWDELINSKDLLFSQSYLKILEDSSPGTMEFFYVSILQNGEPAGIAYYQSFPFSFLASTNPKAITSLKRFFLGLADALFRLQLLICGSVFLTGKAGYFFLEEKLNPVTQQQLLDEIPYRLQKEARIIFIKDLPDQSFHSFFQKKAYTKISFQPAMILSLSEKWHWFGEYLQSMTSKYRLRARRAEKKIHPIRRKELDLEKMAYLNSLLHRLYLEVAQNADFNAASLGTNYFLSLKKAFPDRFRIFGYFLEDELVGFSTTFLNHNDLEAHFLGLKKQYNRSHQLYLNMLYDIVEIGIHSHVSSINFARTALEIKSSVGAKPVVFHSYVKHQNKFLNSLMPFIIKFLEPELEWVQRHPFKK